MTAMLLVLTSSSPWNSNYCSEDGQVLYVVTAPFSLSGRTATVEKAIYPGTTYETIATIEFNAFKSSVITFPGNKVKTADFFRKSGFGWHGRNRVFTGPDGREYKWKMNSTKAELCLNDDSKTVIAKYHRHHGGLVSPVRHASLEIFPPGDQCVDMILTTFVYVERLRKERERAAENSGGG